MSIESPLCRTCRPPESTSYAWDISHALVTTYHPYCHSPSSLTEYLKQKLHRQRAQQLSCSLPTQVESSVPLECNTKDLVAKYYWWPQLAQDVQEYVKGCTECQRNKVNTHPQKAPLLPITPLMEALPFQTITMDFIVKLLESAGFDSILTIMDHDCTKMLITIPCRETIAAEGVAKLFLRQIFPRFGL